MDGGPFSLFVQLTIRIRALYFGLFQSGFFISVDAAFALGARSAISHILTLLSGRPSAPSLHIAAGGSGFVISAWFDRSQLKISGSSRAVDLRGNTIGAAAIEHTEYTSEVIFGRRDHPLFWTSTMGDI